MQNKMSAKGEDREFWCFLLVDGPDPVKALTAQSGYKGSVKCSEAR